jgi:hypothetical protein
MMKEHPILFSAPMVRAILEGRKTMTRRVIKLEDLTRHPDYDKWYGDRVWSWRVLPYKSWTDRTHESFLSLCPYGQPGDRLYIRESARVINVRGGSREIDIEYQADKLFATVPYPARLTPAPKGKLLANGTYREASRIRVEITAVRVERLQDISEEDAECEGIQFMRDIPDADETLAARQLFEILWDSINAKRGYGWNANPWVWVIEFRLIDVPKN